MNIWRWLQYYLPIVLLGFWLVILLTIVLLRLWLVILFALLIGHGTEIMGEGEQKDKEGVVVNAGWAVWG